MLAEIVRKIERHLFRRGYHVPEVRKMVLGQVVITILSPLAVVFGSPGIDFICGVLLGSLNFLALAKVIQQLVFVQRGAVAALMFSFYGRLAVTAVALYLLIVYKHAAIVALLLGISTVLINILLWGMKHFLGKTSKEA